jgi:hypothetical protein
VTSAALVSSLRDRGVTLRVVGGRLQARPVESLTADVRATIREHKAELLAALAAENTPSGVWAAPTAVPSPPPPHEPERRAAGFLELVPHAHRCRCGREFRCTTPACATEAAIEVGSDGKERMRI